MREVSITDAFAAIVPEGMDPFAPSVLADVQGLAEDKTWAQYGAARRPTELRFQKFDWLVTQDADEADAFQPTHDCAACRAGADQLRAFLAEHPDRWVVVGNVRYVEVWDE